MKAYMTSFFRIGQCLIWLPGVPGLTSRLAFPVTFASTLDTERWPSKSTDSFDNWLLFIIYYISTISLCYIILYYVILYYIILLRDPTMNWQYPAESSGTSQVSPSQREWPALPFPSPSTSDPTPWASRPRGHNVQHSMVKRRLKLLVFFGARCKRTG